MTPFLVRWPRAFSQETLLFRKLAPFLGCSDKFKNPHCHNYPSNQGQNIWFVFAVNLNSSHWISSNCNFCCVHSRTLSIHSTCQWTLPSCISVMKQRFSSLQILLHWSSWCYKSLLCKQHSCTLKHFGHNVHVHTFTCLVLTCKHSWLFRWWVRFFEVQSEYEHHTKEWFTNLQIDVLGSVLNLVRDRKKEEREREGEREREREREREKRKEENVMCTVWLCKAVGSHNVIIFRHSKHLLSASRDKIFGVSSFVPKTCYAGFPAPLAVIAAVLSRAIPSVTFLSSFSHSHRT